MKKFHGTGIALVTPFNADGSIDFKGLQNVIEYIIGGGVDYLVSLGTTGETSVLTREEKQSIWEFTAEINAGRVPLIAGLGGNNTRQTALELANFNTSGYEAILSVSPYYNKPTQEGIYQHYRTLANASPLPIILYNVPGRTGSNISAETTLRLAQDFKNIIGIKEASANFEQFNLIIKNKPEDFLLISGDDLLALPMVAMGAVGVISVAGNALPKIYSTMVNMCLAADFTEAQTLHNSITKITNLFFEEGNPAGVKAALKLLNLCEEGVRLPLVSVSGTISAKIADELEGLNLI